MRMRAARAWIAIAADRRIAGQIAGGVIGKALAEAAIGRIGGGDQPADAVIGIGPAIVGGDDVWID